MRAPRSLYRESDVHLRASATHRTRTPPHNGTGTSHVPSARRDSKPAPLSAPIERRTRAAAKHHGLEPGCTHVARPNPLAHTASRPARPLHEECAASQSRRAAPAAAPPASPHLEHRRRSSGPTPASHHPLLSISTPTMRETDEWTASCASCGGALPARNRPSSATIIRGNYCPRWPLAGPASADAYSTPPLLIAPATPTYTPLDNNIT